VFERERPDGTVLEIRGNPLPGGGFVTSYADITAYKSAARDLRTLATTLEQRVEQRTQELQEAKRDAEYANRSKTRFVTAAIHDLQQPLHAARMYASAMRERLTEPETIDLAHNVEESLAAQESILSGLLDIARLESGTMPTKVGDLSVNALFAALGREFGILAQAKGLKLRCLRTRAVVRSDEALLRRILQNFLSNAIRYTQRGGVLLGCRRRGASLRIEVWDTGPGIPERHWREIFEEFKRLDTASETAQGGVGLGLAIVDRVARLLGHSVDLRSEVGRGTMFALTLPTGDAAQAVAPPQPTAPLDNSLLHGRNVWCIDDDRSVRDAISALLNNWGCHVFTTSGANDDNMPATPADAPDLLILDYQLGERNGLELLSTWAPRWPARSRVILVTAQRDPSLEEQARDRGWGFLYKPVRPPALRALMKQLLVGA
jgi:histidine kinase